MKKGGTYIRRTVISLVLALAMLISLSAVDFADTPVQHISDGEKVVNARVVNPLGTNNDCLWKGETSLTNPSGRNLVFDGATYAYHTVDQLGFTLYLQRKATANGIVSNVSQHSYDKESASHIYKALTKTVNQSGYYRISAYFYTDHDAHQFEDFGTATSWMWVD